MGGHVVMITPGGLIDIDEYTLKFGSGFVINGIDKVPRILECGDLNRNNEAPICTQMDITGVQNRLTWFRYIK